MVGEKEKANTTAYELQHYHEEDGNEDETHVEDDEIVIDDMDEPDE